MALLQYVCSVPLAREIQSRSLAISSSAVTVPSLKKLSHAGSHVLLGMSEKELQQVAADFGQESYRGKQLHHLLFKRKAKGIQDFNNWKDLDDAGWRVGRSRVHRSVTAADGTVKVEGVRRFEFVPSLPNDEYWVSNLLCCLGTSILKTKAPENAIKVGCTKYPKEPNKPDLIELVWFGFTMSSVRFWI